MKSNNEIGTRIRRRREYLNLTQAALAEALCVSPQAVSKWERGETAPDISLLLPLARLLETSSDWLLGGSMDKATNLTDDEKKRRMEAIIKRNLHETFPELKKYLFTGANVLDVGCGPGSITLDVAQYIDTGKIIGIDIDEQNVQRGRGLAKERGVRNAQFIVMDGHNIEFESESFDLTYSNTVLHSCLDPVAVLKEQKRVVKQNGWVIAAGVRDWVSGMRYPECPALEAIWDAFVNGFEEVRRRHTAGEEINVPFLDLHAGRKVAMWFFEAGLRDPQIDIQTGRGVFPIKYAGGDDFEPNIYDLLPAEEKSLSEYHGFLMREGFINDDMVRRAREEVRQWYDNPHSFCVYPAVIAAGRK
jgi:SAM-dependent methyltransferase